jgi:hypothetical protein
MESFTASRPNHTAGVLNEKKFEAAMGVLEKNRVLGLCRGQADGGSSQFGRAIMAKGCASPMCSA